MTANPEHSPGAAAEACPLCGAPVAPGSPRCAECGLHQSTGPERPNPFTAASLWALAGLLAVVYALTVVAVMVAR
ncbi:MAG: hypothetical protein M5T61_08400 [Acidimicrobiia bacterium]|nr:hypothetical protein [Acidimicrobiia bacterium]